ncbi:hypothetical protein EIN_206110 [Entamoeba invadens IP1]|uniref:Nitroreductase domain-containing protein n=1 Tax=Entamoeba invadens IP1 TaxID=370355 RepID=A0A0A1U9N4_ENTIV|nr:hypothetical protein EIN_206110 [Entamoeba invadens IP1]ELP91634.1 hypothetical protein EIN_206110 [Entamoeba invadens IP1]|eukprot:XP_004258405.1 hypothetical protein EIN_206110 [Entamoeba invadens IP1]
MDHLFRRSCRQFEPTAIEQDKIKAIVKAGQFAPTGRNNQEITFHVITDQALLQKTVSATQDAMSKIPEHAAMASNAITYKAPLVITMTSKKEFSKWSQYDCGFAAQNMIIAADLLGLGALPIGIMKRAPQPWEHLVGLKEDEDLLLSVAFGYPVDKLNYGNKEIRSQVIYYK